MVKYLKESSEDSNLNKNLHRIEYITDLMKSVQDLPNTKFECDSVSAAIAKVYNACTDLEDLLFRINA